MPSAVAELFKQHRQAAFPGRLRSVDVAGVEMVTLDADVAACVRAWLDRGGAIDDQRWDVLAAHEQQLIRVISELVGYEASYCQRLLEMTVLVLDQDPRRMI